MEVEQRWSVVPPLKGCERRERRGTFVHRFRSEHSYKILVVAVVLVAKTVSSTTTPTTLATIVATTITTLPHVVR